MNTNACSTRVVCVDGCDEAGINRLISMARLPRLSLAGYPHHVIQRGNNRQVTFLDAVDFEYMLRLLGEYSERTKVAIHSYVLMGNHFHLLATPETAAGLPAMMQSVGRRYVRHFNGRHHRSGTLWEGRYRAALIDTDRYLLACAAYIDLNPVRAGLVSRPQDYRWSSHRHYVGVQHDKLVKPHPLYWQLGNTPFAREASYLELVNQGVPADQQHLLTETALKNWALGDQAFLSTLQKSTQRRVAKIKAGRPPSSRIKLDQKL